MSDQNLTQLNDIISVQNADLLYVVRPSSGTSGDAKINVGNFNLFAQSGVSGASGVLQNQIDNINNAATGYMPMNLGVTLQTGTGYIFGLNDHNSMVQLSGSSPITAIIPSHTNTAFPVGTQIFATQSSNGAVTISGASGVTINSLPGTFNLISRYSSVSLSQLAIDSWLVAGIPLDTQNLGPITATTIRGQSLNLTGNAGTQIYVQYSGDANKYYALSLDSAGRVIHNSVSDSISVHQFQTNGTVGLAVFPGNVQAFGSQAHFSFNDIPRTDTARFDVSFACGLHEAGGFPRVGMGVFDNVSLMATTMLWETSGTKSFVPLYATPGNTLNVITGANSKGGTFLLSNGSATITNTGITNNSIISCSLKSGGGTPGLYSPLTVLRPSVGFLASGAAGDNSLYNYIVLELASNY